VRTLESLYYLSPALSKGEGDARKLHVSQWEPYTNDTNLSAYDALQNILDFLDANKQDTLHAETQIMIKPGYKFRIMNGMITNFHQPKSTLLLLVSAFVNGNWKSIYDYALENDFRFLSYGDSSLLLTD
jgi:S-adenosylmethionine:tRNA ribosyltransferase-isomerase